MAELNHGNKREYERLKEELAKHPSGPKRGMALKAMMKFLRKMESQKPGLGQSAANQFKRDFKLTPNDKKTLELDYINKVKNKPPNMRMLPEFKQEHTILQTLDIPAPKPTPQFRLRQPPPKLTRY